MSVHVLMSDYSWFCLECAKWSTSKPWPIDLGFSNTSKANKFILTWHGLYLASYPGLPSQLSSQLWKEKKHHLFLSMATTKAVKEGLSTRLGYTLSLHPTDLSLFYLVQKQSYRTDEEPPFHHNLCSQLTDK